ncbi:MAG: biotin--[acetyl-CoA-carboxylase] ligase [Nitrosomonas sp.]|nr:biotin--[acetyl-CoA-carboxylase] ligase [Nitrosomonas sp.]MDP1952062.1 biotin--[acetyl-CoA-carboxylase] ligase [Nitrosomonas sp.]
MNYDVTVHEVKETDSTNSLAKKLASEGAKNLTLIWAHQQSGGRGRYGRDWIGYEGNVFWSMILRPRTDWPRLSGLSHVAALAVHATISSFVDKGKEVQIKWPNDVLVNRKKISGILLEANLSTANSPRLETENLPRDWVVVGIGINVTHFPTKISYPATSLHAEGALNSDRDRVMVKLTGNFVAELERYLAQGSTYLRDQLLPRMIGLGDEIIVRMSDHSDDDIIGVFNGMDEEGCLIVATDKGSLRAVSTGDVFFGS